MRISKVMLTFFLLFTGSVVFAEGVGVPEPCIKLVAALEVCDQGDEGPFGTIRKACINTAQSQYKCDMPVDEVRKLIKQ